MRRLQTIQKCNSTAVLLRHFFGLSVSQGVLNSFLSGILFFAISLSFGCLAVMGQEPDYSYDSSESKNLDDFSITVLDAVDPQAKINRLIIAVDIAPNGEKYVLTFGNGIKKVRANGGLENFISNQSDRLSNAMDFAINSEGKFFVATNESNRRFVRVYSPNGNYLQNETLGDGSYGTSGANKFKGPVGLTFDEEDNLYVADHYLGDEEPPKPSSIKIYRKDVSGSYKGNLINEFDSVEGELLNFPYRIAVNSEGDLYMSELGQDNNAKVRILELDTNFNPSGEKSGPSVQLGAPGSIIIDKFDNIFIADFGDEIDLPRLLGATNDVDEFFNVFEIIKDGIQNDVFNVNIYNPDNTFSSKISSGIDFPIDLALSNCGTLYVNNAIFDGEISEVCFPIFGCQSVPDITMDFDLEAYQRSAGYDTEAPTIVSCPEDQEEELINGAFALEDYRSLSAFKDNCDDDLNIVQTPPPNTSITETTDVKIVAIDDSGNESDSCLFQVIIKSTPDTTDPVFTSCTNLTYPADIGECGANVNYNIPEATDDSGVDPEITWISGPKPGDFVPVGETKTVVYRATDESENSTDCSFTIAVIDNEAPVFIDCPNVVNAQLATGETSILVNFPDPVAEDNCSGFTVNQTGGKTSGTQFTEGTHPIEFTVTDASGRTAICRFNVIVNPADENLPPTLKDCPLDIDLNTEPGICGAVAVFADPTAEDPENDEVSITRTDDGPSSGEIFPVGTTTVTYEASDGINPPVLCSFDVTVIDNEDPEITCPSNIVENVAIGETGKIITYSAPYGDNCSGATVNQTAGLPSASLFPVGETTTNTFVVTDAAGNTATCSFTVTINEADDEEDPVISCPNNIEVLSDPGACGAEVEYDWPTATDNAGEPTISIINGGAVSGSFFPVGETEIKFEAKDATGNTATCTLKITVKDEEPPVFTVCPQNSTQFVSAVNGKYVVPDLLEEVEAVDNCGNPIRYEQTPAANEEITQDVTVNIRAFDELDNESNVCSIQLVLVQEDQPSFECGSTAGLSLELDEDCNYSEQDFRSYVINRQNFDDGIFIEQTEERLGEKLQVNLKVYHGTDANSPFVGECNLVVTLEDNIPPEINSCSNSPVRSGSCSG